MSHVLEGLAPGSVLGFPTIPRYPDSPPPGRFSALTLVGVARGHHVIVPMAGIWDHAPTLAEVRRAGPRRRKKQVLHFAVTPEDPVELTLTELGTRPLEPAEAALPAIYDDDWIPGGTFAPIRLASDVAEDQWRFAHDGDALRAERTRHAQRQEQERRAAQERVERRLRRLTFAQLLAEQPFERWEPSPPFPPAAFREAATARVHQTCRTLDQLGRRPRRAELRSEVLDLVAWFNQADEQAGWVIETEEREDVHRVLEDICHAGRHPTVLGEALDAATW